MILPEAGVTGAGAPEPKVDVARGGAGVTLGFAAACAGTLAGCAAGGPGFSTGLKAAGTEAAEF